NAPAVARLVAEHFVQKLSLHKADVTSDGNSMLFLEVLACGPQLSSTDSFLLEAVVKSGALLRASRQLLGDLSAHADPTISVPSVSALGLARDAGTALWALRTVSGCSADATTSGEGVCGFRL
ncbi:unnamed protein product, partial [Polarella glacialis]